jgi:hypothetical protein
MMITPRSRGLVQKLSMNPSYSIEPGSEAITGQCTCCGGNTHVYRGFVYRDQNAFAIYLIAYTDGHPEVGSSMTLSIRGWGDGADRAEKESVSLRWHKTPTGPGCSVVEPEEAFFREDRDFLGPMLTREEAMLSGRAAEAFQIADAIWSADARLAKSLA